MYNNNQPPRRRLRRYSPGRPGRATVQTAIILSVVFLAGCVIGALVGIGIYRAVGGGVKEETFGTIQVIDPGSLNGNQNSSVTTAGAQSGNQKLICIDPGHGFYDNGALSPHMNITEATINMKFSKLLRTALENKGFKVVFTHDGVNFPHEYDYDKDEVLDELSSSNGMVRSERRDLAMALSPDYFISIHCNTYADDTRIGGMVIYYEASNKESGKAASAFLSAVASAEKTYPMSVPAKAEGKSGNDVYTVTGTWENTPAVLAELGYLTSVTDSGYFQNDAWYSVMAEAYAQAIAAYFA